ncbi:hypothetical protein SADUNF_Sadunf15G0072300 [Salix dunnii]|uniref:Uncharacterized protein n=1 Tax=Salix dunnii TaxID=1413687 RepID=A0A835MJ97_9ROSI|nr:hypothetical protein SADUNF_Sadunf15G0072300 [Salix dunnii]
MDQQYGLALTDCFRTELQKERKKKQEEDNKEKSHEKVVVQTELDLIAGEGEKQENKGNKEESHQEKGELGKLTQLGKLSQLRKLGVMGVAQENARNLYASIMEKQGLLSLSLEAKYTFGLGQLVLWIVTASSSKTLLVKDFCKAGGFPKLEFLIIAFHVLEERT